MMLPCQFSETQILVISPHMNTEFEWDSIKAASNQQKHGVSFVEAATVFFDPLSLTVEDPLHSVSRIRVGCWLWFMQIAVIEFESLVHALPRALKEKNMSQKRNNESDPDMLDEYDFSNGVRGKYVDRFAKGSNVIVLDPDVAEVFPDSESVNQALRALAEIIRNKVEKRQP